jgi:hypothetical protein
MPIEAKEYNFKKTSKNTTEIGDVMLKSRNNDGLRTRQVLSARIIDNSIDPECSLNISLIHQKSKAGQFDKNFQDLRSLEPGASVCVRLDTLQTKQVYDLLREYYGISKAGVQNGRAYLVKGVNDINNIMFTKDKDKIELMEKLYSELDEESKNQLSKKPEIIKNIFSNLPRIRIDILEKLKNDLQNKLSLNEKEIQRWIDNEPKIRCLIFGLEFIDYKREVQFGNSRFDLLTEQSGTDHVIIEMKSPNVQIFEEKNKTLKNGLKKEFIISRDLAEAIPQTIKYFREYESGNDETWQKVGTTRKRLHKALIIIGRKEVDPIWQQHFCDLNNRISGIEILTYDHLVEKMGNQINNLKELNDL